MPFHTTLNNVPPDPIGAPIQVTAARAPGANPLHVTSGALFGSPSPTAPMWVSVFRAGIPITVLEVTGVAGNILTVTGPAPSAVDAPCNIGDTVMVCPTADHFTELQAIRVPQVQCSGDSQTFGYGLTYPSIEAYPALVGAQLGAGWLVVNQGISGWSVGSYAPDPGNSLLAHDPGVIGPLWAWQRSFNVFSAFGGTNDFVFGGSLSQVQTDYTAWCHAMRTLGYRVIAWTMTARSAGPAFEANRQSFNIWLRYHYGQFADELADVALVPEIGAPGADTNTTYFIDGVHPTPAGHAKIAPVLTAAIQRLATGAPSVTITVDSNHPGLMMGSMMLQQLSGSTLYQNNLAVLGGSWVYTGAGAGSIINQDSNGGVTVYSAPSGSAGNAASLTNAFSLDSGGNVSIPGNYTASAFVTTGSGASYYLTRRDTNAFTFSIKSDTGDFQVHSFSLGIDVFVFSTTTGAATFNGNIVAGQVIQFNPQSDASAANSSIYLGSDHLDGAGAPKLCRKSGSGAVTVIG